MWEGLGSQGHTAGRGRCTIPVTPAPSRLLWTAALSARPLYLLPVAVDLCVGLGPLPLLPPVHPLLAVGPVAEPPSDPPRGRPSGLPSGNPPFPLSAAMRCPVMTQDAVHLSGAVCVGSGRSNPAYLTSRRVIPLYCTPSPSLSNTAGTKVSLSTFSTGPKVSPMPGVTRCTNSHSCRIDFCSPAYADCGCLR